MIATTPTVIIRVDQYWDDMFFGPGFCNWIENEFMWQTENHLIDLTYSPGSLRVQRDIFDQTYQDWINEHPDWEEGDYEYMPWEEELNGDLDYALFEAWHQAQQTGDTHMYFTWTPVRKTSMA